MSVILGILAVALIAFAAFTYKFAPRARAQVTISVVAGLAAGALALGLPYWQISLAVIAMMTLLLLVVFAKNTVRVQKVVAVAAGVVLALAFVGGTAAMLRSPASVMPSASISVMEGGNPVAYPITNSANNREMESAIRLVSGENNIPAIRYYAYEAEKGTNNMGPALHLNTAQDGVRRFGEKLMTDPLYAGTLIEFRRHSGNMSQEAAHQRARGYVKDRQMQMRDSRALLAEIESVHLADFGATRYESLGMIPGSNPQEMPTLTRFSQQPAMEQTLVVRFKDGTGMYLRVACDLQPALKQGFKGVPTPPNPEKPPTIPPTVYTPPAPPSGGAPPPAPPSTPPTTPPSTPPSTPPTTPPSTPPSTPPTTPPSTPPTTPTCPPEHPDCKDPDAGPDAPEGHTPAPAPSGKPETALPEEPNPIDPSVPTDAPAPGVAAPGASDVPTTERPADEIPDPVAPAPAPNDPGVSIPDPDASAGQMGAASAPALQAPAPVAPVAEPQAPAPAAPVQEAPPVQPAPAPAGVVESAPPVVDVEEEVAPMSFNQQSAPIQGGTLLLMLFIGGLLVGSLVRKH